MDYGGYVVDQGGYIVDLGHCGFRTVMNLPFICLDALYKVVFVDFLVSAMAPHWPKPNQLVRETKTC